MDSVTATWKNDDFSAVCRLIAPRSTGGGRKAVFIWMKQTRRSLTKGKRVERPSIVNPNKLEYATHLREQGLSIREIVEKPASLTPASTDIFHRGQQKHVLLKINEKIQSWP